MNKTSISRLINGGLINVESYSASPGFSGYFEYAEKLNRRISAVNAIDLVISHRSHYSVGSSIHVFRNEPNDNKKPIESNDSHEIIRPLNEYKILKEINNYESELSVQEFDNVKLEIIKKACLAIMDIDGVYGHFFIILNSELVCYPHEDVGFGFISYVPTLSKNNVDLLHSFGVMKKQK